MPSRPNARRSLKQYADEQAEAKHQENAAIARTLRNVRADLREKEAAVEDMRKRLCLYESLDKAKLRPPTWATPSRPSRGVGIPTLMLSDVHWDETVYPEQIGGINCYNRRIQEQRLRRVFDKAVSLPRDYHKGTNFEGFQLMLGGDIVSGLIHEELKETNAGLWSESILTILDPLVAGIDMLAKEFKRVSIAGVVGNHGRLTKKPRAKFRAQDNFDWFLYKMLERIMSGRKDVSVVISDGADQVVRVYNTRYMLTHGDQFKGGTGISGLFAPLMLGVHRKRERQTHDPFDVMVMGHWHQTIWAPDFGFIVGGSVVGYNEYAYQKNLKPEVPKQAYWITTPEYGVTFPLPIFCAGTPQSEGWKKAA